MDACANSCWAPATAAALLLLTDVGETYEESPKAWLVYCQAWLAWPGLAMAWPNLNPLTLQKK
jgi:hypothetical protein